MRILSCAYRWRLRRCIHTREIGADGGRKCGVRVCGELIAGFSLLVVAAVGGGWLVAVGRRGIGAERPIQMAHGLEIEEQARGSSWGHKEPSPTHARPSAGHSCVQHVLCAAVSAGGAPRAVTIHPQRPLPLPPAPRQAADDTRGPRIHSHPRGVTCCRAPSRHKRGAKMTRQRRESIHAKLALMKVAPTK